MPVFGCPPVNLRAAVLWAGLLVAAVHAQNALAAEPAAWSQVRPIVIERCAECHGGTEPAARVDFTLLTDDRAAARQRKLWRKAVAQIEAGAMPPADEPQLSDDERTRLLAWMKQSIAIVDASDPANRDPGPAPIRRLSLAEYNRTIHDLLGFEFDATDVGMTEDAGETNGFANLAVALDIPPALLEKYFAAADQILDRLFGTELSSFIDGRIQEDARVSREQMFGLKPGAWRKMDLVVAPPEGASPRDAAREIIGRIASRAYRGQATTADVDRLVDLFDRATRKDQSYVDAVRLMLKAVLVSPKFLYRIETDRTDRQPGEAYAVSDRELAVRLSYFLWYSMPDDELLDLAGRGKLTSPGPSTEPIRFPGTVVSAAGAEKFEGNSKVFDGDVMTFLDGPDAASHWIGLDLGSQRTISQLRFAGRPGIEGRLVGGKFQASSTADFSSDVAQLYEPKEAPPAGWVTRELDPPVTYRYVRYLPPPNAFGNIAEMEVRGLDSGTVLEQQVRRMLGDRRARALTDHFAARWLQLSKLPTARPSTEFFPEFSGNIRQAMFDETATFFDGLRRENRSLLELLDADYTYLNEELAKYYGIPDVSGKEMRRVALKPEYHRGGLLGMGSVLALTSHTSRTSPTLRGKWILDVIFGAPPPPPPANVSQIADERDKTKQITTFRQKLAQHAQQAACAACHRKMDPLGFALDRYSAVGLWRDQIGQQPIDVSGELPGGAKLNGEADLKRVLRERKDDFVRNLTEQLLIFALGRELDYYDDGPVQEIVAQLQANDYRFATLVMAVAKSYPFQYRKNQLDGR